MDKLGKIRLLGNFNTLVSFCCLLSSQNTKVWFANRKIKQEYKIHTVLYLTISSMQFFRKDCILNFNHNYLCQYCAVNLKKPSSLILAAIQLLDLMTEVSCGVHLCSEGLIHKPLMKLLCQNCTECIYFSCHLSGSKYIFLQNLRLSRTFRMPSSLAPELHDWSQKIDGSGTYKIA